eukprot:scaffold99464_cov20-Tisochrysis_lutea.AAC.7
MLAHACSNLAACYTKLGAYPEGVKAADKCIELAPSFAKGYSRKGGSLPALAFGYQGSCSSWRMQTSGVDDMQCRKMAIREGHAHAGVVYCTATLRTTAVPQLHVLAQFTAHAYNISGLGLRWNGTRS